MSEQHTFLSRIGHWFTGGRGDALPLEKSANELANVDERPVPKISIFRPWARRDAAIVSLQQGFGALSSLMGAIRDNLERQGRRQDEMLSYLSHLPEILQSMPEAQRIQGETLKAIGQQIQNQMTQQTRLTEILAKVAEAHGDQRQILEALHQRVDALAEHDQSIADRLGQVGSAMESVGRNSESSAQVLQQMRDRQETRDDRMHEILRRQNSRVTAMLAVAMILSLGAIAAVGVVGYQFTKQRQSPAPAAPTTQPEAVIPAPTTQAE